VRWHRVDSFFDSGPQSRHYVLDRINGVVTFGDGQKGMIPPIGRDNIKADYQSGGGLPANKEVKAGVIKELRTSLLFVDRVTNVMDARGGSAHEDLEMVLERGPQTIKHRDRAVTTEDYVWLAKEASTLVRQVKCLPTTNAALQFEAGAVTLLLVPDSNETKPRPDQELIRTVKNYILERCLSVIEPNIYIIPPDYVPVAVNATVKALVPEESSVVEGSILSRLNTFLHPVKGGPTSRGWEFGRYVYISEIHQLIEDIEGVDVVESVVLNNDPLLTEIEIKDNQLPISGTHDIIMKTKN
jgi:predicted phage baseplate assembly protein